MKVRELVGKINIDRLSHHTMVRFIDCKEYCPISNRIAMHRAYKYWGNFSVITYYIVYNKDENIIYINVFIDPDERR